MKKVLLVITLLSALLLFPAIAFAGEKTTPTENKPASASAKKAKEMCVVSTEEYEDIRPDGKKSMVKDTILENLPDLNDKCYCSVECYCNKAREIYTTKDPDPKPQRDGLIIGLMRMPDKAFRCFYPNAPKGRLTREARTAAWEQASCVITEEDKKFYPDTPCFLENRETRDK